jgi:hypothetical protein
MRPHLHRPPLDRSALDEAKRRLPISTAWRALNLPGEPRRLCCSPFREERHPSFSIEADALWHDFADGTGGDVVSFVKRATDCTDAEAIRRVLDLAGGNLSPVTLAPRQGPAMPARPPRDELTGLDLQPLTVGELERLADLRAWPLFAGLAIASRRGLLCCGDVRHRGELLRAWVLTDNDRRAGMARRMDGEAWQFNGHTSKTNALRSDDEHPPGLADVVTHDRPGVLICEGEPDTLAALLLAWLADVSDCVGVLCLPGARRPIPPAVCAKLRGRRCRIVRQSDPPGKDGKRTSHAAALAWLESLTAAGVSADVLPLDGLTTAAGQPAKDLADLCRRPADHETLAPLAAHVCAPFTTQ